MKTPKRVIAPRIQMPRTEQEPNPSFVLQGGQNLCPPFFISKILVEYSYGMTPVPILRDMTKAVRFAQNGVAYSATRAA